MNVRLFLSPLACVLACAFVNVACTHTLEIRSEPPGADVYVDGEHVGQTPVTIERPSSHEDVLTLSVQKDGLDARLAVLENAWAWEPVVAGVGAMVAVTVLGVVASGVGYVGLFSSIFLAASLGPAIVAVVIGAIALFYGGAIAAALSTHLPFIAAGEFARVGPDEVLVDFRRARVTTSPSGHAAPLIGVSEGHRPLRWHEGDVREGDGP